MVRLAATDPANPYGAALPWPEVPGDPARMLSRSAGAMVMLRDGALLAYQRRANPELLAFLPEAEPERGHAARDLARMLARVGQEEMRRSQTGRHGGLLIAAINGMPVGAHPLARHLMDAGFVAAPMGLSLRRVLAPVGAQRSGES